MKKLLLTLALLLLASTLEADNATASVLITDVEVTVGPLTWCNTGNAAPACAGAGTPWNLGAGIPLDPGQTLVLTQTAGYNFDTSDGCPAPGGCRYDRVVINGQTFVDTAKILAGQIAHVVDPVDTFNMEAADWLGVGSGPGFGVSVGYADTLHTNPVCTDSNGTCLPDGPFADATYFIGAGAGQPNAGYPASIHCSFALQDCYDSGAILISTVPVPATWLLMALGIGGMGLALHKRRT